jgi:hypothetical protein
VLDSKNLAARSDGSKGDCWLCTLLQDAVKAAAGWRPPAPVLDAAVVTSSPGAAHPSEPQDHETAGGTPCSPVPQEQQLSQPQQRQEQQPENAPGDCLGCRVTGLMLGLGGAGYVSSRLFEQPYPQGAHRVALVGVSAALLALGLGRAAGF